MRNFIIAILCVLIASVAFAGPTNVYGGIEQLFSSIFGESLTSYNGNATGGDTTVLAVGASNKFRLYRVDFTPVSDVTGTINIKLGTNTEYAMVNATGGSPYGMKLAPMFVDGVLGADVIINAPAGSNINYNIHGKTL